MTQQPPSFDNTEIAFGHKTNKELDKTIFLFKLFKYPFLVYQGPKLLEFALKLRLPIKKIVRNTVFNLFCGGETIEECQGTIISLAKNNIGTILDYSVEGESKEQVFDHTLNEILKTVEQTANFEHSPFCVFKMTGLMRFELMEKVQQGELLSPGEQIEFDKALHRVDSICFKAKELGSRVLVDAEESWIQDTIDKVTESMMEKYNSEQIVIFNTIQLYRKDRLNYLKSCVRIKDYKQGYKLVRGAYLEKERERASQMGYSSPVHETKEATDHDFNAGVEFCLEHLNKVQLCSGTHNEKSSLLLCNLMEKHQVSKNDNRVFFAQLYGMSDHISYNLAQEGYNVVKYVPYGPVASVMPYLARRAEENSSIGGQVGRELQLLKQEQKRRKKMKSKLGSPMITDFE